MIKILLLEDDTTLASGIKYFLNRENYYVDIANSCKEAMDLIDKTEYDLYLLDVMLPDGNGFEICQEIRKNKITPIIFLTAQDDEENIVRGLDIGGDDYIGKPFRTKELLSRIKAIMRRSNKSIRKETVISGDIKVNLLESKVYKGEQILWLTPSEYKLLLIFINNFNQALSRKKILEELWDIDGELIDDNSLSVYIRRLRGKIEEETSNPKYIKTVRGVGYIWDKKIEEI